MIIDDFCIKHYYLVNMSLYTNTRTMRKSVQPNILKEGPVHGVKPSTPQKYEYESENDSTSTEDSSDDEYSSKGPLHCSDKVTSFKYDERKNSRQSTGERQVRTVTRGASEKRRNSPIFESDSDSSDIDKHQGMRPLPTNSNPGRKADFLKKNEMKNETVEKAQVNKVTRRTSEHRRGSLSSSESSDSDSSDVDTCRRMRTLPIDSDSSSGPETTDFSRKGEFKAERGNSRGQMKTSSLSSKTKPNFKKYDQDEIDEEQKQELINMFQYIEKTKYSRGNENDTESRFEKEYMSKRIAFANDFYKIQKGPNGREYNIDLDAVKRNVKEFLKTPVPPLFIIKSQIRRQKSGGLGTLHPNFYWNMEEEGAALPHYLMAARKRKKSTHSNFLITTNTIDLADKSMDRIVGKLRGCNMFGTQYVIYDEKKSSSRAWTLNKLDIPYSGDSVPDHWLREELGFINYESSMFGMMGPRKLSVIIPEMLTPYARKEIRPKFKLETLESRYHSKNSSGVVSLKNKEPTWNEQTQAFVLNFRGRVTKASVKNFQMYSDIKPDTIFLQFGKIGKDAFTLDFCYPLCPLQAFAIALSSLDPKLIGD